MIKTKAVRKARKIRRKRKQNTHFKVKGLNSRYK